ncbi:hypothetical protein [Novipirellula artificiosorum]|uniref:Uncharacterized protein n=1 Tax=Novipirellula artificiosorum TaxID=2528016 RepID=A0A5C6D1Y3_9BACT|nr:hypothetical protein [Novipirellula artificiosorum]TWU31193.1 hypothetical protein Poly41_63840 [Novipirellula artificiosorum]
MKTIMFTSLLFIGLVTLQGCGSGDEPTVNERPENVTANDYLEMEQDSEQARMDAIRDGN